MPLFAPGSDEALVAALRAGDARARAQLFDAHGPHVQRVLARVLGVDQELGDLLHDVFIEAYTSIARLDDPRALRGWLTTIAVFTARGCIRRRKRRSWLRFFGWDEMPEAAAPAGQSEAALALRRVQAVLERMPEDDRIAFALRFLEGMELTEVAAACQVSLATIKRRLSRAEERFRREAASEPALGRWLDDEEESP
ncbi:MAG: RNA polymerase sigma factor [Myxococcales bacterium]|nr:MAG: RNA polymerase sigma factor [Myxococcales bacterium]